MTALAQWQNFYVIVGSSAGALIGVQFVVLALVASMPASPDLAQAGAAFTTPTIVHFTCTLLVAVVMSVPWPEAFPAAVLLALTAFCGLIYALLILRRMLRQTAYKPIPEDWLFHTALPLAAHSLLIASAWGFLFQANMAFFGVAAVTVLLLLTGIHNAWDIVSYHVFVKKPGQDE